MVQLFHVSAQQERHHLMIEQVFNLWSQDLVMYEKQLTMFLLNNDGSP